MLDVIRAQVDDILEPDNVDTLKRIYDGEKGILQLYKPNVWNVYVSGNMEREMEVEFEKFLINIADHTHSVVDEISTFKFYSMLEYLKEKYKPKQKKS